MNNAKVIKLINGLIEINNDRTDGYETAANEIAEVTQAQVKALFFTMAKESRGYKEDLKDVVVSLGGEPAKGSTAAGKLYRVWMDVKAAFTRNDLTAALESCEYGEDVALKAYQEVLQTEVDIPENIVNLITKQRQELKISHDRIKSLRDEYRTIKT